MIKNLALFAFVTALLIVSFVLGQRYPVVGTIDRLTPAAPGSTGGEGFLLSDEQLRELLTSARSGNVDAMRQLYYHYEFAEADHAEARKWEHAMAGAGDALSQHAVIKDYLIADDPVIRKQGARLCSAWLAKPKAKQLP